MRVVAPPVAPVYRIARRSTPVFRPVAWRYANPETRRFEGRFDDPLRPRPGRRRFRMIYCSSQRIVCLAETLPVHVPLSLTDAIMAATDDPDEGREAIIGGVTLPDGVARGIIAAESRLLRQIGSATIDPDLRFVDIAAAETLRHLRRVLGVELDLSVITSAQRHLTQQCARYIYEAGADLGGPFAGIRFLSHLDGHWENWAVFSDRLVMTRGPIELRIAADDADLVEVARIFEQVIEVEPGTYLHP
jgi:hypothetical protein